MLTHSLTLVNRFGSGGTGGEGGGRMGWLCEGAFGGGGVMRVGKRDISAGFVPYVKML